MEIQSETEGVVITRWDDPSTANAMGPAMEWRDATGDSADAYRSAQGVFVSCTRGTPYLPLAELARFAAGEGPPEPPIAEGEVVTWLREGPPDAEVIVRAVKPGTYRGDQACIDHDGELKVVPLSRLTRAES